MAAVSAEGSTVWSDPALELLMEPFDLIPGARALFHWLSGSQVKREEPITDFLQAVGVENRDETTAAVLGRRIAVTAAKPNLKTGPSDVAGRSGSSGARGRGRYGEKERTPRPYLAR
jgi:hypothetical protein